MNGEAMLLDDAAEKQEDQAGVQEATPSAPTESEGKQDQPQGSLQDVDDLSWAKSETLRSAQEKILGARDNLVAAKDSMKGASEGLESALEGIRKAQASLGLKEKVKDGTEGASEDMGASASTEGEDREHAS